jgi:CRP/FNR family transcriptional regulator, cyclic AMP receptor protein
MTPKKVSEARIRALLKTVPLLSSCSRRELSVLAGITQETRYRAGDVIIEAGEAAGGLHVVLEGETRIEVGGRTRRKLGAGSFFGEIALLDGGPRSATVVATTEVRTLLLPAWSFSAILRSQPRMATKMLKELAHRLRTSDII